MDQININKVKLQIIKSISFINNTYFIYYFLLTLAIFTPLLRPGYILTLDTIWAENRNYLAEYVLSNGIGGQTPFLIFIQFFEMFLPSWAIQKIILFLVILISGITAHVSVPSKSVYGKYFGGTLYAVNPFFYTRFLAGHLYLLFAYAFVPVAVRSFFDFLYDKTKWKAVLLWTTIVGIFSPHILFTLFLIQTCIFLFFIAGEKKERPMVIKKAFFLGLFFVVLNSFWIFPFVFSASNGSSILNYISTPDLSAFTGRGTISGNILISLSMMYGFWRGGYVYPFHLAPKWIFILLFAVILFFAVHGFLSTTKKNLRRGLVLASIISLVLASGVTYPYFAPIFMFLFEHLFIFKGMRDSQKFVGVLVLAYSFLGSMGVDEIFKGLESNKKIKALPKNKQKMCLLVMAGLVLLVPVTYSFTMFNGFNGQVEPIDYPAEWYEVKDFLNNDPKDFDVLFFPWHQYITFKWSGTRILNPASIFFEKQVICGQNAEVGGVGTQSSNPTQLYIEYLLEHKKDIDNFGELVAPLNVKYIILAKDVDYQQYDFLYNQNDLKLIMENKELIVFMNLHETSRIREVDSLIEVTEWGELVDMSKTIDINDYGFVLTAVDADDVEIEVPSKPAKELLYTEVIPLKYHLHESGNFVLFTAPNHDQSGWVFNGNKGVDSAGLTSVFRVTECPSGNADIYYKPLIFHVIGTLISLTAVAMTLLSRHPQAR